MPKIPAAIADVLEKQRVSGQPLAVILAGHNGSGKSTYWYQRLAGRLQIPLVNADRMMLSILPEPVAGKKLPSWATTLRDGNTSWMRVAQDGVRVFVDLAMGQKVPFAMETVFSHWVVRPDGTIDSKIELIQKLREAGYFVLLIFVGLTSSALSIARVQTRVASGGHDVPIGKLRSRFPKTQTAIQAASMVADATVMVDNSRTLSLAFSLCRVQLQEVVLYDRRDGGRVPSEISAWLDLVCPPAV